MSKRKQHPSSDEEDDVPGAGAGEAGAGAPTPAKRMRMALVKVDSNTGAIIRREDARTSKLMSPIMKLTGHKAAINCVEFDPSGEYIATGSFDRQIYIWGVYGACEVETVLTGHKNAVLDLAWAGDGSHLFSCSADKVVSIWDPETGRRVKKLQGHNTIVNSVAAAKDNHELLCSGSDDCTVKVWDCRARAEAHSFANKYMVTAVAFSNDGQSVYAGSVDNEIYHWDVRKGTMVETLSNHTDTITGLAVSPSGNFLLSNSMDSSVQSWDIRPFCQGSRAKQTFIGAQHGFEKSLLRCAWNKSEDRVAAGSADKMVYVWDANTGKMLYRLPGHEGSVLGVSFSPTEPVLASCSADSTVYLGELALH